MLLQCSRHLAALLIVLLVGCDTAPVALPGQDAGPSAQFAEAGVLSDAQLFFVDAAPPVVDAAILTEAGICRTGGVAGVVCAPGNTAPIVGARVSAIGQDCRGERVVVEAVTDGGGNFVIEGLAPGVAELTIHAGRFVARLEADVFGGVVTPAGGGISSKVCVDADSAQIAVLTGDFDQIQSILNALGFAYDLYCGDRRAHRQGRQLLLDPAALARYDIVFINCATGIDLRATNPEVAQMLTNLRAFVAGGGSVYVSDLAADFVAQGWPEKVDFEMQTREPAPADPCCVCGDCAPECIVPPTVIQSCAGCCSQPNDLPSSCRGGSGVIGDGRAGLSPAVVTGDFVADFLGTRELTVNFNLSGWISIRGLHPSVEVLVEDAEGPLMVLFQPGEESGRVAYTAFHNHAQASDQMRRILEALIFRL